MYRWKLYSKQNFQEKSTRNIDVSDIKTIERKQQSMITLNMEEVN